MKSFLVYSFILLNFTHSFSQEKDSILATKYFELFSEFEYVDSMKARIYSDSGLFYAKLNGSKHLIGLAYQYKGWFLQDKAQYVDAQHAFFSSLNFFQKTWDKQGVANAYGNIGNSFLDINNYEKSIDYQYLSLLTNENILLEKGLYEDERINAMEGKTFALHNIGAIYAEVKLHKLALEYEYKSLAFEIDAGHEVDVAISYNTLGSIYKALDQVDSAVYYFKKAIDIYENHDYPFGYSSALQAYASLDSVNISEDKRMEMFSKALSIRKEIGDVDFEARILLDIIDFHMNTFSVDSVRSMLRYTKKIIDKNEFENLLWKYYQLSATYLFSIGKHKEAFKSLEKSSTYKELLDKEVKQQDLATKEIRKRFEVKMYSDSLQVQNEFALERLSHQKELSQKQNVIYLSVIGSLVLLSFLFFFVQSNKRRKRLNEMLSEKNSLIQEQKKIVDEKNKSISDSINYAQRLQNAILPTNETVKQYFPESFILFLPKDVVSGDFHWLVKKGKFTMIAVADCTGHGVPGAMVSVVCSNALNSAITEFELMNPAEILNKTRDLVVDTFSSSGDNVEDGMDISLCVIDSTTNELYFSGANNPLWIIRNSRFKAIESDKMIQNDHFCLYELKGDKQPVGIFETMKGFSFKRVQLKKGDQLFLFSDGYMDQFGGENGKKFMSKRMKDTFLSIAELDMKMKGDFLLKVLEEWKKEEDQVDDICVVGLQIN